MLVKVDAQGVIIQIVAEEGWVVLKIPETQHLQLSRREAVELADALVGVTMQAKIQS